MFGPQVNRWESKAERDVLDAEHHAYTSLAEPVTHRRIVTFDKHEGFWIVEDSLQQARESIGSSSSSTSTPGLEVR